MTKAVQNGFPMAEAALFNAAVIVIKVEELRRFDRDNIPSPSKLRELEHVETMSAVLPGQNVVGTSAEQDAPKKFFRQTVRQELNFKLDDNHESLLETFHAIAADAISDSATFSAPSKTADKGQRARSHGERRTDRANATARRCSTRRTACACTNGSTTTARASRRSQPSGW